LRFKDGPPFSAVLKLNERFLVYQRPPTALEIAKIIKIFITTEKLDTPPPLLIAGETKRLIKSGLKLMVE
jgi:hypothetical protein